MPRAAQAGGAVWPCGVCYKNHRVQHFIISKINYICLFFGEMMKWFSLALRRYAELSGRSQRAEFWYFVLFEILIEGALFMVDQAMGWTQTSSGLGLLSSLAGLVFLWPSITVATRRLHDIGKSGWWQLLAFIPVLGVLVLIYWFALKGQGGANSYGPNPQEIGHF
jgi:uncharacterized membrane protein YhaH (DUF805 family)